MKKFLAVFAVLAMAGLSSIALAADVTVGGLVQVRSRDFNNLSFDKDNNSKNQVDTQERIMIDVNAKAGDDVKGKISLWNDFNDWGGASGGLEKPLGVGFGNSGTDGNAFGFREAWINFNVPGVPVNVTAGHQFLALGNEWFLRSKHFGSDAWVVANVTGNNTIAIVDIKVSEGANRNVTLASGATVSSPAFANSDDLDAYAILDVFKIDDNNMVGFNFAEVHDRLGVLGGAGTTGALDNIELHYSGKLGPVALKAQIDQQMGKVKTGAADKKFKGNQIVIQGNVALAELGINFSVGRGSGAKSGSSDIDAYVNFLDVDPHFGLIYEYKVGLGGAHLGYQNITAANVGASYAVSKSLKVGANFWLLQSTEKVADVKNGGGATTNDVGNEFDINIAWKLYDNLTWNWDFGYLAPGAALGKDAATGAMGILAFKF